MNIAKMTLKDIRNAPGVKDLPLKVGGQFALALKEEAAGNRDKAEGHLTKAVAAEAAL